jgi:biotin carboxyl carrier protein
MLYDADIEGHRYKIGIAQNGPELRATVDGRQLDISSLQIDGNRIVSFYLDNKYFQIEIEKKAEGYFCWLGSTLLKANILDEKTARFLQNANNQTTARKSEMLVAPMPGLIVKVEVEPGQTVKKGQGLIIMEAMKMENELRAAHDCVIGEIKIQTGQIVDKAQALIVFG